MPKIDLETLGSGYQSTSNLNNNFQAIEDELNDKVLYRDNPSGEANQMLNDLDMNSNRIINLSSATSSTEPVTYAQFLAAQSGITSISTISETQKPSADYQAVFTLTGITYTPGAKNLSVYRNGSKLPYSYYTEDSTTQITINAAHTPSIRTTDEFEFVVNQRDVDSDTYLASNVIYTPAGSGAVTTDVQTELRSLTHDTVSDMKTASLAVGQIVKTKGYYIAGDGGGATYLIAPNQAVDGYGDHLLNNGLVALVDKSVLNAKQYGAKADWNGSSGTDISAAITAMMTAARAIDFPQIIVPDGEYYTASKLPFDAGEGASINFIGTIFTDISADTAIVIGSTSSNTFNLNVNGIKVRRTSVDTSGGSVGVELLSLVSSFVDVRDVRNFEEGVKCNGVSSNGGFSYNQLRLGFVRDNKTNIRLTASGSGYCNENIYYGGTYSHSSSYPAVATTNLIIDHFAANELNNNRFICPSFEDQTAIQKAATINGKSNVIFYPRLERAASQATYEIELTSNSLECAVIGKSFYIRKTNITDNGTNNEYDSRTQSKRSYQTPAIAAARPDENDDAAMKVQVTGSNLALAYAGLDSVGVLRFGVLGSGFVYSENKVYAQSGFRWQTQDGTANDRGLFTGSGSPNGVVSAQPGSLYTDTSGGAGTTLYVKESGTGNTGWVGK